MQRTQQFLDFSLLSKEPTLIQHMHILLEKLRLGAIAETYPYQTIQS